MLTLRRSIALVLGAALAACGQAAPPVPRADGAPEIAAVRIEPAQARAGDRLTCAWEGFSDPEGDEDRSRIEWFVNGAPVGEGRTWWGALRHRDVVRCTVTPSDGTRSGAPLSAELVVGNSPPTLGYVSILPLDSTADDALTCMAGGAEDRDGEPVSLQFTWTVDGVAAGSGPTLANEFIGGQRVVCEVTPHDGTESGPSKSGSLTIGNLPPSIGEVRITPDAPRFGETARCEAEGAADPDGDPVTIRYVWRRAGNTVGTGETLEITWVHGEELVCAATANDGKDDGPEVSASIRVGNTPPVIRNVTISPFLWIRADTNLSCVASATDVDGGPLTFTYAWTRNGRAEGTGQTYPGEKRRGDEITCTAVPHDGVDAGAPGSSKSVVVENSPPEVYYAQIEPIRPVTGDTLTCRYEAEDVDGDPLTISYLWMINGVEVSTSATLAGGFKKGDQVICMVDASDGIVAGITGGSIAIVANALPTLESVEVLPSPAYPDTTLTCADVGASDPDGDPVTLIVGWYVNDFPAGVGNPLSVAIAAGDKVRCEASPWDGTNAGEPRSATVRIERRPE